MYEILNTEKHRLEQLLSNRLGNRVRELRLVFKPAGIVLQGRSETWFAKQVAQHAVMELSAVPIVANEIEVN